MLTHMDISVLIHVVFKKPMNEVNYYHENIYKNR
jgi:hypothetical protein